MRLTISGIALFLLIGSFCSIAAGNANCDQKRCGIHEKYNDCGTYWWCERTCDQPDGQACPKICVPGCFCEPDYIRKHANGTCICKDDCPRKC